MKNRSHECIRLRGARQNNLKGFDLDLRLGQLVVVTGLSGSGKSSLALETLHAEGQRRYVETFSPYTRQFLEMLDRPKVDEIENIHPSIAIGQSNTVKTSRSTVGTMTELTDFFKIWFCHLAALYDPESGEKIEDDNPESIWKKTVGNWPRRPILIAFAVNRPKSLTWDEIFGSLRKQGYSRLALPNGIARMEKIDPGALGEDSILVLQDRLKVEAGSRSRFLESVRTALHFGQGQISILNTRGKELGKFSEGLHSPVSGRSFRPASPALFSFNSPLGACPKCRGFGRIIEIDYRLVIPDPGLNIEEGAIRAFGGAVYSESQKDLLRASKKPGIRTSIPFRDLTGKEKDFVLEGDPDYGRDKAVWPRAWYGVRRFFAWLETNTYKMHVRVFLSKYRAYTRCPDCQGARLQPEALNWKWRRRTLPQLYHLPVSELLELVEKYHKPTGNHQTDIAAESILSRLRYLEQVGLGYLDLDRSSRSLSGGEVERVNLTSCLGTSLVDTLFVLDEPSVGLHSRDIDRLIAILKRLTTNGNTVVVVEHDEAIMRAADRIIELGPLPGNDGGRLTFTGEMAALLCHPDSITGAYLSDKEKIALPGARRPVAANGKPKKRSAAPSGQLVICGVSKHNIRNLDFHIPLHRLVCLSGVSGSGKSTLLDNVIYQGIQAQRGKAVEDPAKIGKITGLEELSEIVLVSQAPVGRTPRSNAALYCDAWNPIRELFAQTEEARAGGLTPSSFSFNSGEGRCPQCQGLGYERIEMQFMADVYVTCPTCEGRRFRPEVLAVRFKDRSIADVLQLNVSRAVEFFGDSPKIGYRLQSLENVGLGYLPLGQPLNTLSGGESQRLKLVKYLGSAGVEDGNALLLLDEPTTGLHRHDVRRLIAVLQKLVERGHSLVVIEHQMDILKSADWILEMGPEAGAGGGKIVFAGTPEQLARKRVPSAPFMAAALRSPANGRKEAKRGKRGLIHFPETPAALAAEDGAEYKAHSTPQSINIVGAREHNLKNLSLQIPLREISVITGISGSGKSSLAFDIIFAEGQRRFMESMSAYARQFVEQMPRPDIDRLSGIPPTVAIEQRVTYGTRKSTVATITEVAQYLRLLMARIGVPHSVRSGRPLIAQKPTVMLRRLNEILRERHSPGKRGKSHLYLCAPVVRGRKGHHQPLANWAADHGYERLRIDGHFVALEHFQKLDRYKEHDIEVVVEKILPGGDNVPKAKRKTLDKALRLGKGACFLARRGGKIISWFSTTRTDPETGESYPDLDPKHFSWNSKRGWCPTCRGHGRIYEWMASDEDYPATVQNLANGSICPDCRGDRLSAVSRAVRVFQKKGAALNLPELLRQTPPDLIQRLHRLKLDRRGKAIVDSLLPEIIDRLQFMGDLGLNYLTLDRATATLSGGEAQRIRLAAQLGSNLSGVLYVLDEPSIGLHARDNSRLLKSLKKLKEKGNTLIIVEHDEETMQAADRIFDLGPGAGLHGGRLLAAGSLKAIRKNKASLTGKFLRNGITHPRRGEYRPLPTLYRPRKGFRENWLVLKKASLRNLKGDDLYLPLGRLIMVCGISGAGKSTLIRDLLKPVVSYLAKEKLDGISGPKFARLGKIERDGKAGADAGAPFRQIAVGTGFRRVIEVTQSPIGKTPRSTPATYMGAFGIIRELFQMLPEARLQGHTASTYSFNTKGGRCESCKGAGRIKLAMNFLPDTYVDCEVCQGRRYAAELADIRLQGKNIADVMNLTFEEAAKVFQFHGRLKAMLGLMVKTGLGYLTLGQSSPTLSGGEAQRLKLVSELAKGLTVQSRKMNPVNGRNLYIMEEPTIGLHMSDCEKLIDVLHHLVDQGHTVIVIEHHLDLIAEADYVVEIGPEGGDQGGEILYQGPATGLLKCKRSPTAPYLKSKLPAG